MTDKQPVAPGIARAMRDVRNSQTLSSQRDRALRRWTLQQPDPARDDAITESATDVE